MLGIHLNLTVIGKVELEIARNIVSFITEVKHLAEDERVKKILSFFPEGTVIDNACITLCNEAIAAVNALNGSNLVNAANAAEGIWMKLKADLVKVNHDSKNKKHNIGYYLKCIAIVIEDIANSL